MESVGFSEALQASSRNHVKYLNLPETFFCRVPINSRLGFMKGTYNKVGFGLR